MKKKKIDIIGDKHVVLEINVRIWGGVAFYRKIGALAVSRGSTKTFTVLLNPSHLHFSGG